MSSVGSDYSNHQRSIDDLEKEYEVARKNSKRRDVAREAKLEANLASALKKNQQSTTHAIEEVKDKFERSSESRSVLDRSQRDELKREVYGRAGRTVQAAVSDMQSERDRAIQSNEEAQEKYQKMSADIEEHYNERAAENHSEAEEKIAEVVEHYRDERQAARGSGAEEEKQKSAQYREKLQREARNAIESAHELVGDERRKTRQLTDTFATETKYRDAKSQQSTERRLGDAERRTALELESAARHERLSRSSETAQLRDKLNEISQFKEHQKHEYNQGRSEAIRELESDWRAQMENAQHSYADERDKLKESSAESERRLSRNFNGALKDQGSRVAQVISKGNAEHAHQMAEAVTEYDRAKKHIEETARRSVELTQEAGAQQRGKLIEEKDEALTRQARTYQQAMGRQRVQDQAQIQNLERVLNQQATTDDPGQISAAAEAKIRGQMEAKYEKTLRAEVDRNRENRDRIQQSFERKIGDAYEDNSFSTMKLQQQALLEQQNQKKQFLSHVQDVEHSKSQQVALSNQQTERTRDSLTQLNERGQTELRRHYDDLLNSKELDHDYKINTLRQDTEFKEKNMRRDFGTQTSDLIRNYEKQITEQKTQYEDQLKELKARTDHQLRDSDKKLRQALDQQERAHNQRFADTDTQHRERERLLRQQHEDELDKVKRANALLLSKTSLTAKS